MRIFATSDIHGNKSIIEKLRSVDSKVDLILICGDVGGKGYSFRKNFKEASAAQRMDAAYLDTFLKSLPSPSRFILGNDDWFEYDGRHYLSKPETIAGLCLVPFEWVGLTPFNTNREANDNKINYELTKLQADRNSIIVAHEPPYGCGDMLLRGSRCGSLAVRSWIEQVQPKLWLCGHIHEDNSVNKIGDTLVFNCACRYETGALKGWLIDTDSLEFEKVVIA